MIRSSRFLFLVIFATKLRKYYVIFVYILQGNIGKREKDRKKSDQNTKYQKTKIWDERNKKQQNTISYRIDRHNWARYLPLPLHLPLHLQISPQGWQAWARAQALEILALYQVHILEVYMF